MFFFKKQNQKERWIIAGLGNFGPEYEGSRHNCGFDVIDILSREHNINVTKKKFRGVIGEGKIKDRDVVLVKPATFMNLSGECVREVMNWYKAGEDRLIVIFDDADLEPGAIRVRASGSGGSHKGINSVLENTDTDEFARVRVGIGKKPPYMDMADFVLGHFTPEEAETVGEAEKRAAEAVEVILAQGTEKAMARFNKKGR